MAEQSAGNTSTRDLEIKDREIEILKSEILKLRLLLEERPSCVIIPPSTSSDSKSCYGKQPSTKAVAPSETRGNQTCLCHCSSDLRLVSSCNAETQTFETDFLRSESICEAFGSTEDWKPPEGSDYTVADLVKQAVEEASPQSDYIYDENYKMYYSPSTGYYYDMERNLLYDSNSGIYYSYDIQNNTYKFYYQVTQETELQADSSEYVGAAVGNLQITSHENYGRSLENVQSSKRKKRAVKTNSSNNEDVNIDELKNQGRSSSSLTFKEDKGNESSLEDGEIGTPYAESTTTEDSYYLSVSSPASSSFDEDSCDCWPPCIRLIVEESTKLQIGSLLLITCTGAIVGRDKTNRLCIPDHSVSKIHAEASYDNETCQYYVTDLGSQNGTFINETRLSQPKEKSLPHILKHGDHVCFGFCKLLVHIHPGTDTCDECEPGQVQAKYSDQPEKSALLIQTKEEKEKERRQQLHLLKKKFGLQNMNYEQNSSCAHPPNTNYQDRAKERQKTKGSDNPYEKTAEPASLYVTISADNKGYQLLKKMGWKEGEALGAKAGGEIEPVPINVRRRNRAGIGSNPVSNGAVPLDPRNRKWRQAQRRYCQAIQESQSLVSNESTIFEGTEYDA